MASAAARRLEQVRRLNLKVVPRCWFVRQVIDRRRPEYLDLLHGSAIHPIGSR
jgi:predicted GNAT family acetyltransferase